MSKNGKTYLMYAIVAILLIIASINMPRRMGYVKDQNNIYPDLVSAVILFGFYLLCKWLVSNQLQEDFFFTVTSDQKCKGAFFGKPNSFQYDNFYNGKPCNDKDESNLTSLGYGFISNDPKETLPTNREGMGGVKCNSKNCVGGADYH